MRVYFLLYYTLWYSFRSSRLQVQQEQPTLFVFENGTLFASETDCRIDDCQRWQEWHFCFIARLEKDERDEREKYKCGAHFHTRTAHSMLPPESTLCVCVCYVVFCDAVRDWRHTAQQQRLFFQRAPGSWRINTEQRSRVPCPVCLVTSFHTAEHLSENVRFISPFCTSTCICFRSSVFLPFRSMIR